MAIHWQIDGLKEDFLEFYKKGASCEDIRDHFCEFTLNHANASVNIEILLNKANELLIEDVYRTEDEMR